MAAALALDHIVLVVDDVERSLAWYMDHAGLASVNVDEWRAGDALFPSLRVDEGTIIDYVASREPRVDRPGRLDHICFVVTPGDLDALMNDPRLQVVDQGARSGARGIGHSVYVRDPDDMLVEFRCYPPE